MLHNQPCAAGGKRPLKGSKTRLAFWSIHVRFRSNPALLRPKRRIIPLDQTAECRFHNAPECSSSGALWGILERCGALWSILEIRFRSNSSVWLLTTKSQVRSPPVPCNWGGFTAGPDIDADPEWLPDCIFHPHRPKKAPGQTSAHHTMPSPAAAGFSCRAV